MAKLTFAFELGQVTHRAIPLFATYLVIAGCGGSWQRVGSSDEHAQADATLPQLFDAATIYRQMGFIVSGPPLPFVASFRYLAGASADSTLGLFALSLANQALSFHRAADAPDPAVGPGGDAGAGGAGAGAGEFVAQYHVEVTLRRGQGGGPVTRVTREETVRVRSFQETLRADESVIFQHFFTLPPGSYTATVAVRDRNGPNVGRQEQPVTVPQYGTQGISSPVPYYEGPGRGALTQLPRLVLNPRATLPYGGDSLRFYMEAYGVPLGSRLAARAVDKTGKVLWSDTIELEGSTSLATGRLALGSADLPIGRAELEAQLLGEADTAQAPLLVSFSDQWVITNYDDVISILRYFDRQDWVRRLREAPQSDRWSVWREFWKDSDPVPITPEHEALNEYFGRVQVANVRYGEEGDAGWLSNRGEVYITLGEPDDVLDLSHELNRGGNRVIRWQYTTLRLILFFQDQTGFGRFTLTPVSRSEYQRVLMRVRRQQ
jgi:GWxTD domain-containing protein